MTPAKRGRPPLDDPRKVWIKVRVTEAERAAIKARAAEAGLDVSDYLRQARELRDVLDRFVHPDDPCHYDHHGYCQAHHLGSRPCEHEVAKQLLGWADGRPPVTPPR